MEPEKYMKIAIKEAEESLREGNNGFGAVVVKDGCVVSASHDREDTESDPTSHAEINAIREAARKLGKKLSGCILISTHEPCPMCATAIVWAGITEIAFGYSIKDALGQNRKRMDFSCTEVFALERARVEIQEGVLKEECSVLYREDVRAEIGRLRNADDRVLSGLAADSECRRMKWFHENKGEFNFVTEDLLDSAYMLLLERLRITRSEAPIIRKTNSRIVFHSMNFCPTLEACRILGLDTRIICKKMNEHSTDVLLKQMDRRLVFTRNYQKLRPYSKYCEEMISILDD